MGLIPIEILKNWHQNGDPEWRPLFTTGALDPNDISIILDLDTKNLSGLFQPLVEITLKNAEFVICTGSTKDFLSSAI